MKIVLVHNRYRSAAPSGENRVVDNEGQALRDHGHEVIAFERHSDDIEQWPAARRAAVPARVIWSPEARRALTATLREHKPDLVHVHNTFPLLSPAILYACRDSSVPVVATIHNYKLACASGDFFPQGAVATTASTACPAGALRHGATGARGSHRSRGPGDDRDRQAWNLWRRRTSSSLPRSATCWAAWARPRTGPRPGQPDPSRSVPEAGDENAVVYAGRLDEAKGLRLLMAGGDRYAGSPDVPSGGRAGRRGRRAAGSRGRRAGRGGPEVSAAGQVDAQRRAELMALARAVLLPRCGKRPSAWPRSRPWHLASRR